MLWGMRRANSVLTNSTQRRSAVKHWTAIDLRFHVIECHVTQGSAGYVVQMAMALTVKP